MHVMGSGQLDQAIDAAVEAVRPEKLTARDRALAAQALAKLAVAIERNRTDHVIKALAVVEQFGARARCLAWARSAGRPCVRVAMANPMTKRMTRCRSHGGASTGPRTLAGKAAIAASNRRRRGRG